jgi:hypothetical protein
MDFFYVISRHFLDGFFHTKEILKSTTHNPGPHPRSLTMILVPVVAISLAAFLLATGKCSL